MVAASGEKRARRLPSIPREKLPSTVHSFVMFVGWGRSGNSFLGQALNGHVNALVANEGQLFSFFEQDGTRDGVFSYLCELDRRFARRGYMKRGRPSGTQNLAIPGSHQGRVEKPLVIGNSKAGGTRSVIYERPELFERFLDRMALSPKFFFLTRHPREIVGSLMKRLGITPDEALERVRAGSARTEVALTYIERRYDVHSLSYEDFVEDVPGTLSAMLRFLGLPEDPALGEAVAGACCPNIETAFERYPELRAYDGEIRRIIEACDLFRRYRCEE